MAIERVIVTSSQEHRKYYFPDCLHYFSIKYKWKIGGGGGIVSSLEGKLWRKDMLVKEDWKQLHLLLAASSYISLFSKKYSLKLAGKLAPLGMSISGVPITLNGSSCCSHFITGYSMICRSTGGTSEIYRGPRKLTLPEVSVSKFLPNIAMYGGAANSKCKCLQSSFIEITFLNNSCIRTRSL